MKLQEKSHANPVPAKPLFHPENAGCLHGVYNPYWMSRFLNPGGGQSESNRHTVTWMPTTQSGTGGGITLKNKILLAFAISLFFFWIGSGFEVPAPPPAEVGPENATVDRQAGFAENPTPGLVREVTAYNVGVRGQTSGRPCLGATGKNLCRLVAQGLKVCAANFVDHETILNIEGYGECVVLDRMHRRFAHRVDIAMRKDEVDRALEFGIQRRLVEVKPVRP